MDQKYVVEVRKNTAVFTVDPTTLPGAYPGPKKRKRTGSYKYEEVKSVAEVAAGLPSETWKPLVLREGAKGPLVHEFAAVRVWAMRHYKAGPPIWLVLRRTTEHTDLKYYVSNASARNTLAGYCLGCGAVARGRELRGRQAASGDGRLRGAFLGQLASPHGPGSLAHLYVTLTTRDVKHDLPELTLDLAIRILRSSFARPSISEDEAVNIIDYHLERNRVAHDSHRKSWLAKHKRLAKKLLL